MNRRKIVQITAAIIALLAGLGLLLAIPVQAGGFCGQTEATKIAWDSYYFGEAPAGPAPNDWQPFSAIDSDHTGLHSGQDLWLRATLPEGDQAAGQLLVYYYMVEIDEISLYVDDMPVFTSDKLLPAGFISWRIVPYDAGGSGKVLMARLAPQQYMDEGFEVWTGASSALTLKLLRTEAPMWGGAIVMALFSVCSLLLYAFNRSQTLFIYFSVFFLSIAIDLMVLWGGWQFAFKPEHLMVWGSIIHFNWYIGHASGILVTHAIVGAKGSKWIRNLGYAVMIYGIAAFGGWLLAGEQVQLMFYQLFYQYLSTTILFVLAFVLIRSLRIRGDAEIRVFAVGNGLFIGGLVLGRLMSGQIWLVPSTQTLLTSYHAMAQIGWTFAGFIGAMCCLGIIMGMRLMQIARLRSTNEQIMKMNGELQVANEKLSRIDEIRSNMYSEVSHELNTPITAIKGYVQLMLNGTIPVGETRYLRVIHDKSLVMERMIDDMLEIARLENKHIPFEYELLPFSAFFARLCAELRLDMLEHGFIFHWTSLTEPLWPEHVAAIYADPVRVEQVFVNLLSNARKFTPPGGTIQIEAALQEEAGCVTIFFSDTGCGILEKEQEHIFERYYRGQAAKAAAVVGTGLGLPICREIMRAHQGEIGLESSSEHGSSFYIHFPLRMVTMRELEEGETA